MEDDRRLRLGDETAHDGPTGDVRQMDGELAFPAAVQRAELEFPLDHVQGAFRPIDEDQSTRLELVHLASQLGSDRPTGAGDQHDLAVDGFPDARRVDGVLLSREQVGQPDLADPRGVAAPVEQLVDRRDDPYLQAGRKPAIHDHPDRLA